VSKSRTYKWRFYADNNIEREIIEHLRASNVDVLWIAEVTELKQQQDDAFHYHKAAQLSRYLLTRDLDFWDDKRHPLKDSPGVVIVTTDDSDAAKYLLLLLRKLISDYNPLPEPLYIDGVKIRLDTNGITIKMVDHDTQKVSTENWVWSDLIG
jgi:hypothetical protein